VNILPAEVKLPPRVVIMFFGVFVKVPMAGTTF